MRGQTTTTTSVGIIVAILILVGGVWWWYSLSTPPPEEITDQSEQADQAAVTTTVTNFGKQLQMVPLAASSTGVANAVATYYTPYVAPELLEKWQSNPASAPGRLTSSPWPDHIDVTAINKNTDGSYTIQGTVAEVTSVEEQTGGTADSYPVTIMLEKRNNIWLITSFNRTSEQ
jgi:cytoskeletal protein RodZ